MDLKRAYVFRLYPDAKRQKEIDERLLLAQRLYNIILEKAKSEYEKDKITNISKSTLNRYMKEAINENKDFPKALFSNKARYIHKTAEGVPKLLPQMRGKEGWEEDKGRLSSL